MVLIIIRDPLTKFSIAYDPEIRDPSERRSYEGVRSIIDDARTTYNLSELSHKHLVNMVNLIRTAYIVKMRENQ